MANSNAPALFALGRQRAKQRDVRARERQACIARRRDSRTAALARRAPYYRASRRLKMRRPLGAEGLCRVIAHALGFGGVDDQSSSEVCRWRLLGLKASGICAADNRA